MYAHAAVHTPSPAHKEDAKRVLTEVSTSVLAGAPGLLDVYLGEALGGQKLIAVTMWRRQSDFDAVLPQIVEAIGRTELHQWAVSPAEVVRFVELSDAGEVLTGA